MENTEKTETAQNEEYRSEVEDGEKPRNTWFKTGGLGAMLRSLMGMDDDLTMGAIQAIDEAGMTGQIKVYSFTGQNDAIQAVADGKMQMTVMNRADDIAAETCVAMNEYFSTGSTEYYHYTDLIYITKDNVDQFIGKGEF